TSLLAVPDLGLDRVLMYRQDQTGMIDLSGEIPLNRGSGPRHLAADHESEQLHISCERSGMVATAVRSGTAPQRRAVPAPQGPTPGHGAQLGDLVLVAAREGDRIDVLRCRGEALPPVGEPIPAPSVACLAVRP